MDPSLSIFISIIILAILNRGLEFCNIKDARISGELRHLLVFCHFRYFALETQTVIPDALPITLQSDLLSIGIYVSKVEFSDKDLLVRKDLLMVNVYLWI